MPMESFENRLSRFLRGAPAEIIGTVLNSISNFLLPEIEKARDQEMEHLGFLGTHAVIQIVTEKFVGVEKPIDGTRFYLERFVDGPTADRTYSTIADDIHYMRNTFAHVWFSSSGHNRAIDYRMPEGWQQVGDTLHINPRVYFDDFLTGYRARTWDLEDGLIPPARARVQKYLFIRDWLDLPKGDAIRERIKALGSAPDEPTRDTIEADIQSLIRARYSLP